MDFDINKEFERLFGKPKKINLFDTEQDMEECLHYISCHPNNTKNDSKLPFEGVELLPFIEYKRLQAIDEARNKRYRLFYLKRGKKGDKNYCDAAGYYIKSTDRFVLIRHSCVVNKDLYSIKVNSIIFHYVKYILTKSEIINNNRYLTKDIVCDSPQQAAMFVLGNFTDSDVWLSFKGKSITTFYPEL